MPSHMRVACVACAGASMMLFGCGGGDDSSDDTTAAPSPTPDTGDVAADWKNHFESFGDYDEESKIVVFNDACGGQDGNGKLVGYTEITKKDNIKTFFKDLFDQLGRKYDPALGSDKVLDKVGPAKDGDEGTPVVKPGNKPEGNVMLTWRTKKDATGAAGLKDADWIEYAPDSFSFQTKGGKSMIWKQNIVVTESHSSKTGDNCAKTVDATPANGDACKDKTGADSVSCLAGLYKAWDNHFTAFGCLTTTAADCKRKDENGAEVSWDTKNYDIMADYTEDSIVEVFDTREEKYTQYKGLTEIKGMFDALFVAIKNAGTGDPVNYGIGVLVQEVDPSYNDVFLVWKSNSHPKATDTFVFSDDHKIIRQNIVVQT